MVKGQSRVANSAAGGSNSAGRSQRRRPGRLLRQCLIKGCQRCSNPTNGECAGGAPDSVHQCSGIVKIEPILKAYINEASEVEKAGLEVNYKNTAEFNIPAGNEPRSLLHCNSRFHRNGQVRRAWHKNSFLANSSVSIIAPKMK